MFARLIALLLLLCAAALVGVAYYVYSYDDPDPPPAAAAIVVLSGPGADVPGLEGETRARMDRGIALHAAGAAPLIVVSGNGDGAEPDDHVAHAEHMAAYATAAGIPAEAILREDQSGSTLHNAWYTAALDEIDPAQPVIVVTQRYHLPRAWASFRWAGFQDVTLVAADPDGGGAISSGFLLEAVKWPLNGLRAGLASAALALGADEAQVLPWLR